MAISIDLFIHKLRARHELSRDEEAALRGIDWSPRSFERNEVMVQTGAELDHSILLLSGFALRSKYAAEGQRQIVETNIAGDFVDLHGFILKRVTELHPRLTRVLWFQTLVDAAIHREWMLVLGKKRSRARIAQFFCEMQARLELVGQAGDGGYTLPFSQQELADITGMTPVHLNRSLKELRDAGLVTYRNGRVELHDLDRLAQDAQFDRGYLHIGPHEI